MNAISRTARGQHEAYPKLALFYCCCSRHLGVHTKRVHVSYYTRYLVPSIILIDLLVRTYCCSACNFSAAGYSSNTAAAAADADADAVAVAAAGACTQTSTHGVLL